MRKSGFRSFFKLVLALTAASVTFFVVHFYIGNFLFAPKITTHGFGFGDVNGYENKGILILDYRYGNNKMIPSRPADWQLKEGKIPQRTGMNTFDSPADFLYVKWRVLATGKEYEDTVNLKTLLPEDMHRKIIHFIIEGEKLNVYVIEYIQEAHAAEAPHCPVASYKTCKCTRIYPDRWKNF